MKKGVLILSVIFLFLADLPLLAYGNRDSGDDKDSLVRLITAEKARLIEIHGKSFRKVEGNAVFLHNDTYLYCDTAYWNVDDEYIDAIGRIRIVQENTVLTGDSIRYVIPQSTARFRGHLVELIDRDSNVLRTNYLDYNTKDSIAFFYRGAAMKDHDGNLIESLTGRYQSKEERFDFIGDVEMFSDSMFFVCDTLVYDARTNVADFFGHTRGWYDLNTISSGRGRYIRPDEQFYFQKDVHILTEEQELWCDSLFYDRINVYSHMLGNVQLVDTVNNSIALAGDLRYWNDPKRAELYRDPAIVMIEETDDGGRDSLFMASDTLIYYTKRMFEVDSAIVAAAKQRYEDALVDPLAGKKQNTPAQGGGAQGSVASSAGSSADASRVSGPPAGVSGMSGTLPSPMYGQEMTGMLPDSLAAPDSLSAPDSLALPDISSAPDSLAAPDSLSAPDSLAVPPPPDTTKVSFLEAYHNVRIYRSDLQMLCDSLLFSSIDSIVRTYTDPVLWYEIKSQITADSMQFLIRNETLDKGLLFSNAFVISEEEPDRFYHQIKSPEMIGYFDNSQVSRFDALGGVTAMFYIAEDSLITTMNQKECRIMTARLKDGQVQRILYLEKVKSDAYPIRELKPEDSRLRDFNWTPDKRPASRFDVTSWPVRSSLRAESAPAPDFPVFKYAEKYFEGYMKKVMDEIESRKPLIWIER